MRTTIARCAFLVTFACGCQSLKTAKTDGPADTSTPIAKDYVWSGVSESKSSFLGTSKPKTVADVVRSQWASRSKPASSESGSQAANQHDSKVVSKVVPVAHRSGLSKPAPLATTRASQVMAPPKPVGLVLPAGMTHEMLARKLKGETSPVDEIEVAKSNDSGSTESSSIEQVAFRGKPEPAKTPIVMTAVENVQETKPAAPQPKALVVTEEPADIAKPEKGQVVETTEVPVDQRPVRLLRPYGVTEDQPGLKDNVVSRLGVTYLELEGQGGDTGMVGTLEYTGQIGRSALFWHAGAATELTEGEFPTSFSVGVSKLARIEDGCVQKPLILGLAYDGYYDRDFLGTDDSVYMDQIRGLAGWAIGPRIDAGVWGAVSLSDDEARAPVANGVVTVTGRLQDRVAGYLAMDVGKFGTRLMGSVGAELDSSSAFAEVDVTIPLFSHTNLFGNFGYTDRDGGGVYDGYCGLEFNLGQLFSKVRGNRRRDSADCMSACDPCASYCEVDCCPRFRGGWAYDNYRSALRVLPPTRMLRYMDIDRVITPAPGPTVQPPIVPAPDPQPDPPPTPAEEPPPEECLPRWDFGVRNESRLSKFLDSLAKD